MYIYITGEICKGNFEEVQDLKLQPGLNINGTKCKALEVR